jgi:hypothetical protein
MVNHQALGRELGSARYLKNSLSIAPRRALRLRALPENCHLLPSTAISEPQNRYVRFNRFIRFLPLEGVPASLGLGLRTVSGAVRTLGAKLPSRASLSHDRRIHEQSEAAKCRYVPLGSMPSFTGAATFVRITE